jgi:hypothetical protein
MQEHEEAVSTHEKSQEEFLFNKKGNKNAPFINTSMLKLRKQQSSDAKL